MKGGRVCCHAEGGGLMGRYRGAPQLTELISGPSWGESTYHFVFLQKSLVRINGSQGQNVSHFCLIDSHILQSLQSPLWKRLGPEFIAVVLLRTGSPFMREVMTIKAVFIVNAPEDFVLTTSMVPKSSQAL